MKKNILSLLFSALITTLGISSPIDKNIKNHNLNDEAIMLLETADSLMQVEYINDLRGLNFF